MQTHFHYLAVLTIDYEKCYPKPQKPILHLSLAPSKIHINFLHDIQEKQYIKRPDQENIDAEMALQGSINIQDKN